MAQQGRNERCPCGSRRKVKHCYGVRRGPSEAELAKAFLHQQARAAALVLEARSNAEVAALLDAATRLTKRTFRNLAQGDRACASAVQGSRL